MQKYLPYALILLCLFALAIRFVRVPNNQNKATRSTDAVPSVFLNETRDVWIDLPENYSAFKKYPVLYVLDAELYFDLAKTITKALSRTKKIPEHLVVGVPHISIKKERIRDLTFSLSAVNPYGIEKLPPFFSEKNCGGGETFFKFVNQELPAYIKDNYSVSDQQVLLTHSLSAYFASYIVSREHVFGSVILLDPSTWYSRGESIQQIDSSAIAQHTTKVFVAHQTAPDYHAELNQQLIERLGTNNPRIKTQLYPNENHGSVVLPGLIDALEWNYQAFRAQHFRIRKPMPDRSK